MWIYIFLFLVLGGLCNKTIKFYLQLFLIISSTALITTCSIPFLNYKNRCVKNGRIMAQGIRFCFRYISGLQFKKIGMENIVDDTGSVVVMNHQSIFDLLPMSELILNFPNGIPTGKQKTIYMLPYGFVIWAMGVIIVNNRKDVQEELNQTAIRIKNNKINLFFFPEGTRSKTDQLKPFKKGAFHIAIAAQCPIQPIVVSQLRYLENKSFGQKNIKFEVLPPISTVGLTADDVTKLCEDTRTLMQNKSDELNKV